jgi:hypothetical protein
MSFAYTCFVCAKTVNTKADAKAEFELTTGQPFEAEKVAFVCEDCNPIAAYSCDMCGGRFMSSPNWSNAHAAAEFEVMFGKPFDPKNSAVLCDACYHLAMAEMFPDGLARH